jgi:UDP-glucose 4-epimerase
MTTTSHSRKVLIIGGSGYLGTAIGIQLSKRFGRVVSLSRSGGARAGASAAHGVCHVRGDINHPDTLDTFVSEADVVVYLASATIINPTLGEACADVLSNLIPFVSFLELNRNRNRADIVFVSSGGAVYGEPFYCPIDESHPTNPVSSYGVVKLAMEKYLALYGHLDNIRYTTLRVSNPYGGSFHNRPDQGVVNVFARKVRLGEEIRIWGDGEQVRDFVSVFDVGRAVESAIEYSGSYRTFNIGSGEGVTINRVIEQMSLLLRTRAKVIRGEARAVDVTKNILNIDLARRELGWSPTVRLQDGLFDFIRELP